MWNLIHNIVSPTQYIPHGHCYLWQTSLVTLHVVSNALIAIAYFSIPALLFYFVQKRRDVLFAGVFILFGAFIVLCGIGHLLNIWTLWHPAYWLSGIEHAVTALVSCVTALQMVTLLPQFLALKTPAELEALNRELQQEIIERQQIEADRNCAYAELEFRVQERTAALEQSQQWLSRLIEQIPIGIVEWDLQGKITKWNPASEHIFGYSQEEVLDRHFKLIVPEKNYESVDQTAAIILNRQGSQIGVSENITKTGDVIVCEWHSNPLVAVDGTVLGAVSMAMDITDRKQAEAQLQQRTTELENALQELQRTQAQMIQAEKMSGLGQLVAGVAHEINNPVNFISGNLNHAATYTQNLLQLLQCYQQHYPTPHPAIQQEAEEMDLKFLVEDLPKLLTSMKMGADRIRNIVASLRNFSRIDEAEMKEVDIHDGIDSTLMILQHRLKAKPDAPGIEVIREYGRLPLIECYAGQLNQVLMNLLSNAIDAVEEAVAIGKITVPTIAIHTALVNTWQVAIRISDNGCGIPEHVKHRVFDPFYTTKPVGQGTGMGLSISYQIVVEKHQGTLQYTSESGQGTTFTITIPIRQS